MINSFYDFLESQHLIARVFLVSLIPAALTSIGVLPVLLGLRLGKRFSDTGMGFAGGVMLVASFTSLLLPAIEESSVWLAITGLLVGVVLIKIIDIIIPHLHFLRTETRSVVDTDANRLRRAWLMVLAMVVHNIPEGMAVGAAASYSVSDGVALAVAIGVQDIPEGLAVAMPILAITDSIVKSMGAGVISGVVESLAALLPPLIISWLPLALPFLMALAAGAMVYVVVHEISPDIYTGEHDELASIGFITGFIVMLILDTLLA